ncbi:glycine zipper 2TM domain-containing protein [Luteimonas cucumeris]|nr:glycine zipper 2TM domain-containing protein [Luteimonas cucumeris]
MLVSACASSPTSSRTFSSSEAGVQQTVQWGVVEAVRPVTIQASGTGVGTATGAVLGGIAGSTVGGGRRANTAGAVAGAVAGGAAGNAISGSNTTGVEFTVRLEETGQTVAVVQAGSVNDYRVGDRVRVTSDGRTTRVSR